MAIVASSVVPNNSLEEFRIEFNNLVSDVDGILSKAATTTIAGSVELATNAETTTGTDTTRAVTPSGLHSALAGLSDTVITTSDTLIFADATDSNNLKEDTVQGVLDLITGYLTVSNNLSDVNNAATSLNNIGGVGLGIVLALG